MITERESCSAYHKRSRWTMLRRLRPCVDAAHENATRGGTSHRTKAVKPPMRRLSECGESAMGAGTPSTRGRAAPAWKREVVCVGSGATDTVCPTDFSPAHSAGDGGLNGGDILQCGN